MALLTIDAITLKGLALFRNFNFLLQTVSTKYSREFSRKNAQIGDSLRIRNYSSYNVRTDMTAVPQGSNETSKTLTVDIPRGIDVSFSTTDLALTLNDFGDQVLAPVMNSLASACSQVIFSVVSQAENTITTGIDGSVNDPTKVAGSPNVMSLLAAGAILDQRGAPARGAGNRIAVLAPMSSARLVNTMSGFFNPQGQLSKQFIAGEMNLGNLGIDRYGVDQMVPIGTAGTATTATLNGANQAGPAFTTAATVGTWTAGSQFTIAGVTALNPISGADTGVPMQFTVGSNVAAGATSIPFTPHLIPAGTAGANVSNLPGAAAVITPVNKASSALRQNIMFDKSAIEVAFVELPVPSGAVSASRKTYDGVSVRCINWYDGMTDINNSRFDVLMGVAMVRPEWVVIISDLV